MPDAWMAVAAADGVLWSAAHSPRGFFVVVDHIKYATFYTHLDTLFVPEVKPPEPGVVRAKVIDIRAGQPLGVIGADPQDRERIKHLLCAAPHNRCNAERYVMRSGGRRPAIPRNPRRPRLHITGTSRRSR
jgi:hypothetical protein